MRVLQGFCARGEMDITTGFGPVIVGSNPAGRTRAKRVGDRSIVRGTMSQESKPD